VYRANDGQAIEEEMYAAVTNFVTRMPPSLMAGRPSLTTGTSITCSPSARGVASSIQMRRSFRRCCFIAGQSAMVRQGREHQGIHVQMATRGIQAIGRAGEIAAKAGSDLRAEQQADWERREAAKDRAAENFTDYVRGVDASPTRTPGRRSNCPPGTVCLGQRPRRVRDHGESELQPEYRIQPALGADAARAVGAAFVGARRGRPEAAGPFSSAPGHAPWRPAQPDRGRP